MSPPSVWLGRCADAWDFAAAAGGGTCPQPSLGLSWEPWIGQAHPYALPSGAPLRHQHSFLPAALPLSAHITPAGFGNTRFPNFVSTPKGNPSDFEFWEENTGVHSS